MEMALKIWRYDPIKGERALKEYEVDAPDWATLLDVLDIVKDRHDGTLAYRKSCRMMICGSCGMRMDGAAVLACKTRMADIAESGHVPVISAMGNMPIVKDLVVDMEPFWGKIRAVEPWLQPGYSEPGDKEYVVSQEQMDTIHKESLCIMCGCCVSECNSMEADPEFLGPAALAKGMRFVGDPRDQATVERLQAYSGDHGIWDCTRCYFCQERCPKGVDPRDAIAKLGAEAVHSGNRLRHGGEAREVVRDVDEDDRMAPRDRARPEDAGRRQVAEGGQVRDGTCQTRQGAAPVPAARREARRRGAGAARPLAGAGKPGAQGIVQVGEGALAARVPRRGRGARSLRRGLVPEARCLPEKEPAQ